MKLAIRRVEAAICAFGGTLNTSKRCPNQASSIFRFKGASNSRLFYEQQLPRRYYLSGSRISWEVEENPPVYTAESYGVQTESPQSHTRGTGISTPSPSPSGTPDSDGNDADGTKTKYRCKLCGQPKQNHSCPYRQFLQRSIGVMVYPAVNSFTAAEPGIIAPPLTAMNNFVSYDMDQTSPKPEYTDTMQSRDGETSAINLNNVTPEAFRAGAGSAYFHSPQSSLSVPSEKATPPLGLGSNNANEHAGSRKRSQEQAGFGCDTFTHCSPFVAAVPLKQEHYRAVTPSQPGNESSTAYQYPVVPLTFAERKRMSETLFHLSKGVPTMTSDVAAVLRAARQNDEWDLAVAELLTQVVVGLYCNESDGRLEGLQQYLLALGVSC